MNTVDRANTIIGIKGAGEMATGVATCLFQAGFTKILMVEIEHPLAVRRTVAFSEAVFEGPVEVEGVIALRTETIEEVRGVWGTGQVPVLIDPEWRSFAELQVQVVVDATLAKRNLGTTLQDASLVIGLGPGFTAGKDVHRVVETMRGGDLGRVIDSGSALANTGIPAPVNGCSIERILRAPKTGTFYTEREITDMVLAGGLIGHVSGAPVIAQIDGVIRGLIRPGSYVTESVKIGDIDPIANAQNCFFVSDKARAIGRGALKAILSTTILHKDTVANGGPSSSLTA